MYEYKLQYGATKSLHKYKYFKWVLSGRWNQGSGNSGSTATYMEWDELGIGFDNNAVCYGPDYWTFDSYTLDGTPWSPAVRMPQVLLSGNWGTETSKFDASNFVSLVVYFHTTSGEAILPTSIGLYSTSNQNYYQSSTPLHFILSGLNEETNEYEQLIDIGAAEVNKGNTQLTTINSGFTYHYDVINLNRLIYPGWNGYVSFEEPIITETYELLWSGDANNNITLSEPYSAYDALRFICQNTCNNVTVPTDLISTLGEVDLTEPAYKTPTNQPLFSICGQRFVFNADMKTCGAVSSFVKSWVNPNSVWNNNLYYNWTKIYGVKYANH